MQPKRKNELTIISEGEEDNNSLDDLENLFIRTITQKDMHNQAHQRKPEVPIDLQTIEEEVRQSLERAEGLNTLFNNVINDNFDERSAKERRARRRQSAATVGDSPSESLSD